MTEVPNDRPCPPDRCIYTVIVPRSVPTERPYEESLYARIDTRLISSRSALLDIATLPVFAAELVADRSPVSIPAELRPRHEIGYVFDDQWTEFAPLLECYPLGAVFDSRLDAEPFQVPLAHAYVRRSGEPVDVVRYWAKHAETAFERVAPYWSEYYRKLLAQILELLRRNGLRKPTVPRAKGVEQDCLGPNALIRNLTRGYWGRDVWGVEAEPQAPLEDVHEVQRRQCSIADEICASTNPDRIDGQPEAVLVVPSMNPRIVPRLKTGVVRSGAPASLADSLLEGHGYRFSVEIENEPDEKQREVIAALMVPRAEERKWYDAVATCRASSGRDVVFRTPFIEGSFFNRLNSLASMEWSEKTIRRSMNRWSRYCGDLSASVGVHQLEWVLKHCRRVTAICDLPLEWCTVGGAPLGFQIPVARIPLAPGNLPIRMLVDPRPPHGMKSIDEARVLVLNGHSKSDPFGGAARAVASIASDLGFPTDFADFARADELPALLSRYEPAIIYISCHGALTKELGGALALPGGNDALRFTSLPHMPHIAIVSACRSEAVAETYSTPARNLYLAGVRAVLGSYLNLTEPHASMLAASLFGNLRGALKGGPPRVATWADVVWLTLNRFRPVDILLGAARWLKKREPRVDDVWSLYQDYLKTEMQEAPAYTASWTRAPDTLRRVARGSVYEEALNAVTRLHAFRPESMFYTQIGEPHRVLVGPLADPAAWPGGGTPKSSSGTSIDEKYEIESRAREARAGARGIAWDEIKLDLLK